MQEPQNDLPDSSSTWMEFIPGGLPVPCKLEGIMVLINGINQLQWSKIA